MSAETDIKRGMVTYSNTCKGCGHKVSLVANNKTVARFLYESIGWAYYDNNVGWHCTKCNIPDSADAHE